MKKIIFLFLALTTSIFSATEEQVKDFPENPLKQYKPTFIVFGNNKDRTKLQFSFKYQMVPKTNFYLGYTQTSWWDLFEDSSPFYTTHYNPELMYRQDINFIGINFIRLGMYEHKSNGKDGNESRTYDRSYITLNNSIFFLGIEMEFANKIFYVYNLESNNKDLKDYMGFWESRMSIRYDVIDAIDKEEISVKVWAGKDGVDFNRGGVIANIRFRTPFSSFAAPLFLAEYFYGYNQTLLDYNKKEQAVRLGLVFYR